MSFISIGSKRDLSDPEKRKSVASNQGLSARALAKELKISPGIILNFILKRLSSYDFSETYAEAIQNGKKELL